MEKKEKKYTHVLVKDKKDTVYLCPVEFDKTNDDYSILDMNECFKKDVPERYAARITVRDS